jgi:abortive infection bacteriophage resistance protein
MSNRTDKPMRAPAELVAMLRDEKGITFNYMDTAEAGAYLSDKNNYLRTASYRKNYDKHKTGDNEGKYIQLDFAYLVELSKLDMYLRSYLLQMCIDIEHALKVAVIADIEKNATEDGYTIVDDFLAKNPDVIGSISKKVDSVFTGDLIEKYFEVCYVFDTKTQNMRTEIIKADCPVWVLVEVLAFNDFLRFVKHYAGRYPGRMKVNDKLLNTVRNLRNACAHNNCLLTSLRTGSTKPTPAVSERVAKISAVGTEERKNKLSCRPLFEIVCLLMEYEHWVSEPLRTKRMEELKKFAHGRMVSHVGFFVGNQVINTSIAFLQKIVDNFA